MAGFALCTLFRIFEGRHMLRKLVIPLILCSLNTLHAQEATIGNFQAIAQDDYVVLSWTTDSGYTCATLTVSHSTDSINFQQIYLYPGVCGSYQEAQNYTYIHSSPVPDRINYYRLTPSTFNQQLNTQVFFKGETTYNVYPNPVSGSAILYLDNSPVDYKITITDLRGQICYNSQGTSDKILFDATSWKNGKYIYQLQIGYQSYTGSFLVMPR